MKIKYLVIIVAVVITSVLISQSMNNITNPEDINNENSLLEERNAPEPDKINVSGISTLVSYKHPYMDPEHYNLIKKGEYPYIDRAIKNGITLLTNEELNEYYDNFFGNDKISNFAIETENGLEYYSTDYFEYPISLENHNVKINIVDDLDLSAKSLPTNIKEYLKEGLENSHTWITIDENKAKEITSIIRKDGIRFNTIIDDNTLDNIEAQERTIRILYLGPYSEELQLAEFKAIYGDIGKSLGG